MSVAVKKLSKQTKSNLANYVDGNLVNQGWMYMTEVNLELEKKLWSISSENLLDEETCKEAVDYLLKRLSDYLQTPLETVGDIWIIEDSFSSDFSGFIHPKSALEISLGGTLAVKLVDDEYGITISVNLYLFGSHYQLFAGQKSRCYIGLDYLKNEENIGDWFSHGWLIDDYGQDEDKEEIEYHETAL